MTIIVTVIIYFLILLGIGIWAKRKETVEEFLIANRKVNLMQSTASMFAVIGGVLLVGQSALAYDVGFGALWLWIGASLGMIGLGLAAGKLKKLADEHKFLTISDYIATRFDNKSAVLAATILFFAFFALLTGQFIAEASLFAPLLNISYSYAVILLGIGTLLYLLLGGFKAVVKTDFLQFLVMIIVFLIAVFSIDLGEFQPGQLSLTTLDSISSVSLLLIGLFTIFAAPDVWQRLFSAKDIKTAKKATFLSAASFIIFGIILSLIGIAAKNSFPNIDSSEALFYGMFELMPGAFLGLAVVSILAAIMSTIDTELFYLSSSVAKDFSRKSRIKSNDNLKKIIYRSIIVLAILSMILAIFVSDILLLLFALLSLTLCVAPSVMASFIWKIKSNAVFLSMAASLASFLILLVIGQLNPETSAITLPTAIIFLIIGQFVFKSKSKVL